MLTSVVAMLSGLGPMFVVNFSYAFGALIQPRGEKLERYL